MIVAFAVDGSGRVTSVRVAKSSGKAQLDRAAVDGVQTFVAGARATGRSGKSITLPLLFN